MSIWGKLYWIKCNLFMINYFTISDLLNEDVLLYLSFVRINAIKRLEVHNYEILSILYGGLLGDVHGERRNNGVGTRFSFQQESSHLTYLMWLHQKISSLGYCNPKLPEVQTRLGKGGKVRKYARFHTWTYSSFNFIKDEWYFEGKKSVPMNIGEYLTPLALSIWIMDDGSRHGTGLHIGVYAFSNDDVDIDLKEVKFWSLFIYYTNNTLQKCRIRKEKYCKRKQR